MTDNFFDVPDEFADALNQGMKQENNALPFNAPLMWWENGNSQMRQVAQITPAVYYGGWVIETERFDDIQEERGGIPAGFVVTDKHNDEKNEDYQVYCGRMVVVAPMGYRVCWKMPKKLGGTRHTKYVKGSRQHIQMLVMMANKTTSGYVTWGPVILSAKGYQVNYLKDAVSEWAKQIDKMRRQYAPKTPPYAFWMGLGTYGEFNTKMVGNGEQSPITPIRVYTPKPEDMNLDMFKKLFVGKDTVAQMADYIAQSREWLDAWKTEPEPAGGAQAEYEGAFVGSDQTDDIPF